MKKPGWAVAGLVAGLSVAWIAVAAQSPERTAVAVPGMPRTDEPTLEDLMTKLEEIEARLDTGSGGSTHGLHRIERRLSKIENTLASMQRDLARLRSRTR